MYHRLNTGKNKVLWIPRLIQKCEMWGVYCEYFIGRWNMRFHCSCGVTIVITFERRTARYHEFSVIKASPVYRSRSGTTARRKNERLKSCSAHSRILQSSWWRTGWRSVGPSRAGPNCGASLNQACWCSTRVRSKRWVFCTAGFSGLMQKRLNSSVLALESRNALGSHLFSFNPRSRLMLKRPNSGLFVVHREAQCLPGLVSPVDTIGKNEKGHNSIGASASFSNNLQVGYYQRHWIMSRVCTRNFQNMFLEPCGMHWKHVC